MHYRLSALGFEVLAPVGEFAALSSRVIQYEGNEIDIDTNPEPRTAILKYVSG